MDLYFTSNVHSGQILNIYIIYINENDELQNVLYFRVAVHFTLADGSRHTAHAKVGDNLLDIIIENDIDIDGFGWCI
jgi:hypothetical protein